MRYGCTVGYHTRSISGSYNCEDWYFGDPIVGEPKECACQNTCSYSFSSTGGHPQVSFVDGGNYNLARYRVDATTPMRQTFTLTFYQTDFAGRVHSDVMYFDIGVCGYENINDKTPG